jgi:hypothetical protein
MATKKTRATKIKSVSKQKQEPFVPKPVKGKFQIGTGITVLIFIALVGAVFYLNNQKKIDAAKATPTSGTTFVFTAADGIANSIEIRPTVGEIVKLARDSKNVWALELPIKAEANQSSAEAAATQLSSLQILSTVDADPSIFGFDKSAFIITVGFAGGKTHKLEIGDKTPTTSGYYVRLDNGNMMIVELSGIDALTQLVSSPPYLNTPTPSPLLPTETPVSPTQAISTPEAPVTPTP